MSPLSNRTHPLRPLHSHVEQVMNPHVDQLMNPHVDKLMNPMMARSIPHPLIAAAVYGHAEVVQYLLERTADVNAARVDSSAALISAAANGSTEVDGGQHP